MNKQLLEQWIAEHEQWLLPAPRKHAIFEPELFRPLYLYKQSISDVSIIKKDLSYACFHNCNLHLTNFSNTKLLSCVFIGCTITDCIFDYNEFQTAKLYDCTLTKVNYGV